MSEKKLPKLLSIRELAEWLGLTTSAVYALGYRGVLPGKVKVGSRVFYIEEVVLAWLKKKQSQ